MAVAKKMDPEVAAGFLMPYDSWANRIAIHRFVQDIPLHERHHSWRDLVAVEQGLDQLVHKPMLICWGGKDFCFTEHFFHEWQHRFPQAESHYFTDAGHYLLEDSFTEIFPLIHKFLVPVDVGKS